METQTDKRLLKGLLVFSMFGHAHWFFGNLYETVVFTPNQLARLDNLAEFGNTFQAFFKYSNPVFYYIPLSPLSIGATLGAAFVGWGRVPEQRRWLTIAAASSSVAGVCTFYIVTQFNINLFFETVSESKAREVRSKMRVGFAIALLRIATVAVTFLAALRVYKNSYNKL